MTAPALLLDPQTVTAPGSLEAIVVNRTDQDITYGLAFRIEYWDGESWQKTDIAPDVFPQIALIVGPGGLGQPNVVEIPAKVDPGFYRVVKDNLTGDRTGDRFEVLALFQVRAA